MRRTRRLKTPTRRTKQRRSTRTAPTRPRTTSRSISTPDNFITKKDAQALGWPGGSLEPYAPGKCIGGSRFGNYEGLLPEADGRTYTECDIDTLGADSRGAKRIVFSNDGLIYYTEDHYETFELLYGEE